MSEWSELCRPLTFDEVRKVFTNMASDKALGPNGFSVEFYKHAWGTVGSDIFHAFSDFWAGGDLPEVINSTIITLVPKVPNADSMKAFRPISCCNVLYKGLSKILANWLSSVLPFRISDNQTAFVKGRRIGDNVLMAHELVKGYHLKGIIPRCAVKIDLMKAFDSVDWSFLLKVMEAMNLPPIFINWIAKCLQSTMFSVCVNGGLVGYFSGRKGLRQGCPLSPYLFAIVMEYLSCKLNTAAEKGEYLYHPQCKRLRITHLCFADDLLLFSVASRSAIQSIWSILAQFANVSGLNFNPEKCEIFCGGVTDEIKADIDMDFFPIGSLPVRYLGVPLITGKLSSADCRSLVDKITKHIQGWRPKCLTYVGRVQLIKSVLYSMANFWMSVFPLPKGVIAEVERLCSKFLWTGSNQSSKKAKVSWQKLVRRYEEGGLGVCDLKCWNMACSVRHIWNLFCQGGSLWVAWIRSYRIKSRNFWDLQGSQTGSWIWRKLLKLRAVVFDYITVVDDTPLWKGEMMEKFSISRVLADLRTPIQRAPWCDLLWKRPIIPRNSFLTWLVILNRIATRDKLFQWGCITDTSCVFCESGIDSREHLFFGCPYSSAVAEQVWKASPFARLGDWECWLSRAVAVFSGDSGHAMAGRLICNAVISNIWRERCRRVFGVIEHDEAWIARQTIQELTEFSYSFASNSICNIELEKLSLA
ncbi:LINE-1 retrotransposable element ORF2 protein [Linum perenne]